MRKIIDRLLIIGLSLSVLLSVVSYFDAIAQYPTADQQNTYTRIKFFMEFGYNWIKSGSHISFLTVAPLGTVLEKLLGLYFQQQGHVIGNIHLTPFLPFTLIQTFFSVLMIGFFVFLMGRILKWDTKKDHLLYLFSAVIILNLPTLKAVCKILKYDAFSLLLSLLAVSLYILFLQSKKEKYYYYTIALSALAFFEKNTAFSVAFLLVFIELFRCLLLEGKLEYKKLLIRILAWPLGVVLVGIFTVPLTWKYPKEIIKSLYYIGEYLAEISPLFIFLATASFLLFLYFRTNIKKVIASLYGSRLFRINFCLLPVVLMGISFFYQSNEAWLPEYLPKEIKKQAFEKGLYLGGSVGGYSITTLDKSIFITRLKVLGMNSRLLVYFLPETVLLMLLLPFLGLLFRKKIQIEKLYIDSIILLSSFILLYIFGFSYALAPIDPKYLNILFPIAAFLGLIFFTANWRKYQGEYYFQTRIALIVITVLMWRPATESAPSHFGWMNVLRNKAIDNRESLVMGNSGWTWMGWGESAYPIQLWMEQNGIIKSGTKVVFDYGDIGKLFYVSPGLEVIPIEKSYYLLDGRAQIQQWAKNWQKKGVLYLIVTKTIAYRELGPNYIINHFREHAIFTESRQGIEYAWLFRIEDIVNFLM